MMLQVRNSNESYSPKGGLTIKRSNRLFIAGLIVLCTVFIAGCKEKDPFVDPGDVENPNWVVTANNDMTASMTAIVKVSFTQDEGTLAAFIGNACCGVAEYNAEYGLYWLYISSESNDEQQTPNDVQLRFYSPDLKRIFVATETLPFRNDTHFGSVSEPLTPDWTVAE